MVYDPERHKISPETGFAVDKVTGHPVGLVGAPAGRVGPGSEWPKWVAVHESHVVRKQFEGAPEHVSVIGFEQWHVNRADGSVTVLVEDEAEARRAESEKGTPEPIKEAETDAEASAANDAFRERASARTGVPMSALGPSYVVGTGVPTPSPLPHDIPDHEPPAAPQFVPPGTP